MALCIYLIAENLLLRNLLKPGNIGDDDGNDEVDHDNGAEHDEPHQQHHGEHLGHARAGELWTLPEIIELKLSKHHHETLHNWLWNTLECLVRVVKVNDEKGKSKGKNKEDESQSSLDHPLRDRVIHDAEGSPKRGISPEQEDELDPGEADAHRGHDGENIQLWLEAHGERGQAEDKKLKPVLQFEKVILAESHDLPGFDDEQDEDGDQEERLYSAQRHVWPPPPGRAAAEQGILGLGPRHPGLVLLLLDHLQLDLVLPVILLVLVSTHCLLLFICPSSWYPIIKLTQADIYGLVIIKEAASLQ